MREVRSLSRAGRRNQIRLAFCFMIEKGYGDEMTAYDIARKIDLRPQSPNFRDILSGMVRDGELLCRAVDHTKMSKAVQSKFMYRLPDAGKPKKREVAIKANGKQVGQLELF